MKIDNNRCAYVRAALKLALWAIDDLEKFPDKLMNYPAIIHALQYGEVTARRVRQELERRIKKDIASVAADEETD